MAGYRCGACGAITETAAVCCGMPMAPVKTPTTKKPVKKTAKPRTKG